MSLISIPNTFSAGAVIIASQHNSNFSTIYSDYNGNIDNTNIVASAGIVASKLDLTSPGAIGSTAANTGKFTTLTTTGATVLGGTLKLGTTNQGDILYDNGTSLIRLIPGTSGQFLQTLGSSANPIWASQTHSTQIFTTSGTFTAPTGISICWITIVGGGGGAGYASSGNGGGGGGGAFIYSFPYLVTALNTYTATVGTGGAAGTAVNNGANGVITSFGTGIVISVNGGNGGTANGSAGSGGAAVVNTNNSGGSSPGGNGYTTTVGGNGSGVWGGGSILGTGGASIPSNGVNYGGGGTAQTTGGGTGGNGSPGIIIVQY